LLRGVADVSVFVLIANDFHFVIYFPALQPPSSINVLPVTIALASAAR
jgi:hypothetical protein